MYSIVPNIVNEKWVWADIYRNMLMDGLQGQFKNGFAAFMFHWVIWVKLLKNIFRKSKRGEKKTSGWADILQKHVLLTRIFFSNWDAPLVLHSNRMP